jgi:hypothetical protein
MWCSLGDITRLAAGNYINNCMFALKIDYVEGLTKNKLNYQQLVMYEKKIVAASLKIDTIVKYLYFTSFRKYGRDE